MKTHTGCGITILFMNLRVFLSTDRNDLPLGVDEEEERKYELPAILLGRRRADCRVHQAVIQHIGVWPSRRGSKDAKQPNTSRPT